MPDLWETGELQVEKIKSKFNSAIPSGRRWQRCPCIFKSEFVILSKRFRKNAARLAESEQRYES